ncbi:MAG: hypothetical protein QOI01_568, partial [Mycobacterium sp.]|nr:hypothetical protein [Mycobacterium sp.]
RSRRFAAGPATSSVGPERLAVLREASDDVIAAIEGHLKDDCPLEVRGD